MPAGFENKSVRYFSTSIPFACAVEIIEYKRALHFASRSVLLKSQFLRPTVKGLIAFSALLLSIGTSPSSRNVYRYFFSLRVYLTASTSLFLPLTRSSSVHAKKASSKGLIFTRRYSYLSSAVSSVSSFSSC